MISTILASAVILCASVRADVITSNDVQACADLCESCQGTPSFVDGRCECYIADANQQDSECIVRIRRQAEEVGLDLVDCVPATAERRARCHLGHRRRLGTNDAHRIAHYFMNGGPLRGSPFVGAASCEPDTMTGSSNPHSQPQLMPLKLEPTESKQPTPPEPITGASNPSAQCVGNTPPAQPSSTQAYYPTPEIYLGAPPSHYPIHSSYSYAPTLHSGAYQPHTIGIPHALPPHIGQSSLISLINPHHYHHGAPHIAIPRTNIFGATHKAEPPLGQIKQGPIVQPGYTHSPIVGAAAPLQEILPLLQQVLAQQNEILWTISHHLQSYEANVGLPRVFYPPTEPKVGAPAPTDKEDLEEKTPALVVGSPGKKNDCDDGVSSKAHKQRSPRRSEDTEVTTEIPRPDADGRKRKRELKKVTESTLS